MLKKIVQASAWLSAGILLGRLLGLVREAAIAATFGVSQNADIAILMLTAPDLLTTILIGGGLSAALLPEFKRRQITGHPSGPLFVQSSILVGAGFMVVAALLTPFSTAIARALAPGFDAAEVAVTANALAPMWWLLPLTALAGVSRAYLHASDRFAVAAVDTALFNAAVILGLLAFVGGSEDLAGLALFAIAGGLLRWLSQLLAIPRPLAVAASLRTWYIDKDLLRRYWQAASASGLLLFFPAIARALASFEPGGAIAVLNYALKLVEFPLGMGITVLSLALFPRLAEGFAPARHGRPSSVSPVALLAEGLIWTLVLAFAIMVPMMWFNEAFVELAFGWGALAQPALARISGLTTLGLLTLPLQGLISLLTVTYSAKQDMRTPFVVNAVGMLCFVFFGLILVQPLGIDGIVLAMIAAYALIVGLLLRQLFKIHHLDLLEPLRNGKSLPTAAIVLTVPNAIGWLGTHQLPWTPRQGLELELALALATLAGAATVLAVIASNRRYRRIVVAYFRQRGR